MIIWVLSSYVLPQSGLTSRGSNMPFLVTMICLGCSSTGRERIRAATSSAVFHLANYRDTGETQKDEYSTWLEYYT